MAVRYESIDGELVSHEWFVLLSAARRAGVHFQVTEGHRTLARQTYFWNCYRCRCCNNGNLAAFPSPNAPHIRTGRIDHAVDIDPGNQALIDWAHAHGITLRRTVAGEAWHLEAAAAALRFIAGKLARRSPCDILSDGESKLVAKLFYHRKQMRHYGHGPKYLTHLRWARWYKARLNAQAAYLLAFGRQHGFGAHHRGARRKLLRQIVARGARTSC